MILVTAAFGCALDDPVGISPLRSWERLPVDSVDLFYAPLGAAAGAYIGVFATCSAQHNVTQAFGSYEKIKTVDPPSAEVRRSAAKCSGL